MSPGISASETMPGTGVNSSFVHEREYAREASSGSEKEEAE